MTKYFISYVLKFKDPQMAPITNYGNMVLDLPHEIIDDTDIRDLQILLGEDYPDCNILIIWFKKLPE